MRFLMIMIPRLYQPGTPAAEQPGEDFAPSLEAIEHMSRYNEKLAEAGVLLSLDGLHPLSKGARVSFDGPTPVVTDGPFIEAKEVVGGYWILQVKSKEEAVEWARQVPADPGDVIELRRIFEMEDFSQEAQQAATSPAIEASLGGQQA